MQLAVKHGVVHEAERRVFNGDWAFPEAFEVGVTMAMARELPGGDETGLTTKSKTKALMKTIFVLAEDMAEIVARFDFAQTSSRF